MRAIRLDVPLTADAVRSLRVGEPVEVHGVIFTARDAAHRHLAHGGSLPCDLRGGVIYHCGPVVVRTPDGWRVTAAGPTTSIREEPYMADIVERFGVRAIVGKGGMGASTLQACRLCTCVYLHAVGGAAQVLSQAVRRVRRVHMLEEFGAPEAVWELEVEGFPAVVTMDAAGNSLHESVLRESTQRLEDLLRG